MIFFNSPNAELLKLEIWANCLPYFLNLNSGF